MFNLNATAQMVRWGEILNQLDAGEPGGDICAD
jgi:hypothetical protein